MQLFFLFPGPGDGKNGKHVWCPSWKQIMTAEIPSGPYGTGDAAHREELKENDSIYSCRWSCIEPCHIQGVGESDGNPHHARTGTVLLCSQNNQYRFRIIIKGTHPVVNGFYTMISIRPEMSCWVISRRKANRCFEKVSVIEFEVKIKDKARGVTSKWEYFELL
jgi:hypothetical protein